MRPNVAYQGLPGSYSHIVAKHRFGQEHNFEGFSSFKYVFESVHTGKTAYGIIPIENSLTGSIYENYHLLFRNNLHVVAEEYLKINHCLLERAKIDLKKINRVYSHIQALDQCLSFFDKYPLIKKVIYSDTAGAAKYVSEKNDPSCVAIASEETARTYNLEVLRRNIQDNKHNYTRFFVISSKKNYPKNANKCSLLFTLTHKPGSLFHAIEVFSKFDINLTKIESRPIHGKPFEYFFDVDFEFKPSHFQKILKAEKELRSKTHFFRVLGYYKAGKLI